MRRLPVFATDGVGIVAPLVLALLWVPVRSVLPNTELALMLVLAVVAVGSLGRRRAVLLAAASAALWFDFLSTRPFEHVTIARWLDLETTVGLIAVSAVAGELSVRVVRQRRWARSESTRSAIIGSAAALLASGEELAVVIERIRECLSHLLGLSECTFLAGPGEDDLPVIERDGSVQRRGTEGPVRLPTSSTVLVLQVWGHAQVLGHYRLQLPAGRPQPRREDLTAATTLADQVGAAFMAQAPPPPDPSVLPGPGLHVVR